MQRQLLHSLCSWGRGKDPPYLVKHSVEVRQRVLVQLHFLDQVRAPLVHGIELRLALGQRFQLVLCDRTLEYMCVCKCVGAYF
jgi:hypothetical protein